VSDSDFLQKDQPLSRRLLVQQGVEGKVGRGLPLGRPTKSAIIHPPTLPQIDAESDDRRLYST
jgi:hypothetical protein